MKKILLISVFLISAWAKSITMPTTSYLADGSVTDMKIDKGSLYVATGASVIDVFNIKTKKIIHKINISKIKDFMGDTIDSKIYSVDVLDGKVLILSQGAHGFRRVDIYENNKLKHIINVEDKMYIAKAKFLDNKNIIVGLLSNDIISYNIKNKKQNWTIQASQSKFSNFKLNENKSKIIVCDESGDLHLINTKNGKFIKTFSGHNLDNVFQVDYKNGIIATAGQDRRVVIYNTKTDSVYYKTSNFLIYSVGLSPSGKIVGYASDENNDVTLFKTNTKTKLGVFGGNEMTLSNILFLNEKEFFVSSDDKTINFYKLK